jgi:hypothetical protein
MIVKIEEGNISIKTNKIDTEFISNNKVGILGLVLPFFIVLCILWYKENHQLTIVEKTFILVILLTQICTLYACLVKWNEKMLLVSHYIFIVAVPFVLLCIMNKWLNIYYLVVVLATILVWIIYNKCIFDTLLFEVLWNGSSYKFNNNWMWPIIVLILMMYGIKIVKYKA